MEHCGSVWHLLMEEWVVGALIRSVLSGTLLWNSDTNNNLSCPNSQFVTVVKNNSNLMKQLPNDAGDCLTNER